MKYRWLYLPRIEKYTSENWHLIGFVIFQLPANQTVLMVAPVLTVSVGALPVIQDLTAAQVRQENFNGQKTSLGQ